MRTSRKRQPSAVCSEPSAARANSPLRVKARAPSRSTRKKPAPSIATSNGPPPCISLPCVNTA
jgi:hypothetical protein